MIELTISELTVVSDEMKELIAARAFIEEFDYLRGHKERPLLHYHGEDCAYGTNEDGEEISDPAESEPCECGILEVIKKLEEYDRVKGGGE